MTKLSMKVWSQERPKSSRKASQNASSKFVELWPKPQSDAKSKPSRNGKVAEEGADDGIPDVS